MNEDTHGPFNSSYSLLKSIVNDGTWAAEDQSMQVSCIIEAGQRSTAPCSRGQRKPQFMSLSKIVSETGEDPRPVKTCLGNRRSAVGVEGTARVAPVSVDRRCCRTHLRRSG